MNFADQRITNPYCARATVLRKRRTDEFSCDMPTHDMPLLHVRPRRQGLQRLLGIRLPLLRTCVTRLSDLDHPILTPLHCEPDLRSVEVQLPGTFNADHLYLPREEQHGW